MSLTRPFVVAALSLCMTGAALAAEKKPAPPARPASAPVDRAGRAGEPKSAGYLVEPPPAWVEPAVETPGHATEHASMHYRVIDDQIRVDGRTQESYSHVVRVVDEAAGLPVASQIELEFDPSYQTLVVHRIDVVRDGKRTTRLDRKRVQLLQRETQLERRMYDGRQTFSLVLDDVRVGDEVDLAYTVRGANPVFEGKFAASEWMVSFRGPVAQYQLRLLTPVSRKVEVRPGSSDMKVSSRTIGSTLETLVQRDSVPAMRPEVGASVQTALDAQLVASEYADWADVARWGRALFAEPAGPMPGVDQKAAEIRAAHATPAERALAALDFVQKDVRYFGTELGVNSHRPASPEKVLQQRFGDCKDKVSLFLALLSRMDIAGDPYLVSTGLRSKVAQALPSPLVFDHVIARVTIDGQPYWLDATRGQQAGPLAVRQAISFGQGLLLAADTTAPSAQPPVFGVPRFSVDDRFSIDDFAAPPTLESRMTFYGELAEGIRESIASGGLDAVKTQLSQSYVRLYPKIKTLQPLSVEEQPEQNALVLVQRFSVPEFFRFPDQRALVGEAAAWSLIDTLRLPNSETRRDAFMIGAPGTYTHHIHLEANQDVAKASDSKQADSGDAFFAVNNRIESTPKSFDSQTELVLKAEEIPASEWTAHLAELRKTQPLLVFSFLISAIPLAKVDALGADIKALVEDQRSGRVKVKTRVQGEARVKVLVLGYQIDGGRLAPPLLAQALTERGIQYDHLAQYDKAALDFDRAVELAPDRKETLNAAAVNASARGQTERVMALTTTVLKQSPKDWEALNSRMLTRYMSNDFAGANTELDALLQNDSAWRRGYPLIMWSLTHRYLHDSAAPPNDASRSTLLPSDWPRPLIDWLRDKTDTDAVLRAARAGTTPAERLCEAYFYMGEKFAADGDVQHAAEYYRKAVDQGITEFVEDDMARRRLAALPKG